MRTVRGICRAGHVADRSEQYDLTTEAERYKGLLGDAPGSPLHFCYSVLLLLRVSAFSVSLRLCGEPQFRDQSRRVGIMYSSVLGRTGKLNHPETFSRHSSMIS